MHRRAVSLLAMTPPDRTATDEQQHGFIGRRKFLAVGGAVATALVAGCTGGVTSEPMGTFRLYISDQPVAIDEFDSLDVTIDGARLYRGEEESEDSETTTETTTDGDATETSTTESETTTNETETTTEETTTETEDEEEEAGDGFVEIEVDDETVDLTTVTGEKALGVFEGEVPTGRYATIHLSVSQVEGVVDGEDVDVSLPSGSLKIVKPFEVTEEEPLEFVFDITVVKKGQTDAYNLLPVIGESGVVGEDVEMQAVERAQGNATDTTETTAD